MPIRSTFEKLAQLGRGLWPDRQRRRRAGLHLRKALAVLLGREQAGVLLHLDEPGLGSQPVHVAGPVQVKGWALAPRGIRSVSLFCGGRFIGDAAYGIARTDVAVLSAQFRRALQSGFQFTLDPRSLSAGQQELIIEARSRDGRAARIACQIEVRPQARQETVAIERPPNPMSNPEEIRRILVVMLDHIGDVLLGFPALDRLRELYPSAHLTVLVGPWAKGLAEGCPVVDQVLSYEFFQASSEHGPRLLATEQISEVNSWLSTCRFDLAIDFRREPETRQFLQWSGARYTAGFANGSEFDWLTIAIPYEPNVPQRSPRRHVSWELLLLVEMLAIAGRTCGCPRVAVPAADAAEGQTVLESLLSSIDEVGPSSGAAMSLNANYGAPKSSRLRVAIHPGSGRSIKCWPLHSFAELADRLCIEQDAIVVFFGSAGEAALVQSIRERMRCKERSVSAAGCLSIVQFVAAVEGFDLYIGNDSGPTHLAAAQGVPTVCIGSGTVEPLQWSPLGPAAVTVRRPMFCSPCFLRNREDCPYDTACMRELTVADILGAIEKVLIANAQQSVPQPRVPTAELRTTG